jgi:hypothetical protein
MAQTGHMPVKSIQFININLPVATTPFAIHAHRPSMPELAFAPKPMFRDDVVHFMRTDQA